LSPAVADAYKIPTELRGYVAIALQSGFISLDGNLFNPARGISRLELAKGMNAIVNR
jgi:S-layer homology domain.